MLSTWRPTCCPRSSAWRDLRPHGPGHEDAYEVDPPNNGTLIEGKAINFTLKGDGGFDIAPRRTGVTTDIGLGIYQEKMKSTLFRTNVETGETKLLVKYKSDLVYTGIAISPL